MLLWAKWRKISSQQCRAFTTTHFLQVRPLCSTGSPSCSGPRAIFSWPSCGSEPLICPGIIPRQETMPSGASPPELPHNLEQPTNASSCRLWGLIPPRSRPSTRYRAPVGPFYTATQQSANRQKIKVSSIMKEVTSIRDTSLASPGARFAPGMEQHCTQLQTGRGVSGVKPCSKGCWSAAAQCESVVCPVSPEGNWHKINHHRENLR